MLHRNMYKTWRNNQRRLSASVSLSIIILIVGVSTTQLTSMVTLNGNPSTFNDVYAKYSNDQAQSLANECGISDATGVNCGINSPLMQGDGLASSPIVTQSGGGQGEQGPPGPDKELQVRTVVSSEYVLVPPLASREISVECNPDEVVTGGALLLFDDFDNYGNPSILEAGLPVNQPTEWL
jgi:hypothetical protein